MGETTIWWVHGRRVHWANSARPRAEAGRGWRDGLLRPSRGRGAIARPWHSATTMGAEGYSNRVPIGGVANPSLPSRPASDRCRP